jgi:hypothetical protein
MRKTRSVTTSGKADLFRCYPSSFPIVDAPRPGVADVLRTAVTERSACGAMSQGARAFPDVIRFACQDGCRTSSTGGVSSTAMPVNIGALNNA